MTDPDHRSKITPAALRRMKERTAEQQLNDTLRELRESLPDDVPDSDDGGVWAEPTRRG